MPNPNVDRLVQHWAAHKLVARHGTSPEQLTAFETTHKVTLPADLRDYFLQIDGMDLRWPNDQDANGFSLWPLARVRPVTQDLAKLGVKPFPEMEHYFTFADYLGWSWAYAIRLGGSPQDGNRVILIGKEAPIEVARSFAEFVDLYVEDSPRLYGQVPA